MGLLYTGAIRKMVLQYVDLIAKHLTFKESLSRKAIEKDYRIKDELKN